MAKAAVPDIAQFKACKSRITDYYEHNADSIREKKSVKATAKLFEELAWLTNETHRLGGLDKIDEKPRFFKIQKKLAQVVEDHADSIRTGAFIQINSDWFAAYRYLVRCVEKTFKGVLEIEDQFDLGGRLPDVNNTISLDLEEGLDEDEEPKRRQPARASAAPARPVRAKRPEPEPEPEPEEEAVAVATYTPTIGPDGDDDLPGDEVQDLG